MTQHNKQPMFGIRKNLINQNFIDILTDFHLYYPSSLQNLPFLIPQLNGDSSQSLKQMVE